MMASGDGVKTMRGLVPKAGWRSPEGPCSPRRGRPGVNEHSCWVDRSPAACSLLLLLTDGHCDASPLLSADRCCWDRMMWPCNGVGNRSVGPYRGVSHTEVVQAPHVPPHAALELPMVQLCPCLGHGFAGAGVSSTSPILWALMQREGEAGQPCNNIAPQISCATIRAAKKLG